MHLPPLAVGQPQCREESSKYFRGLVKDQNPAISITCFVTAPSLMECPRKSLARLATEIGQHPGVDAVLWTGLPSNGQKKGAAQWITETNPVDTLMTLAGAQCVSRALHVVADLGIADALGDTPADSEALAQATGTAPDVLDRILRLLSGYGIFASLGGGFRHTPASLLLRTDHPASLRSFVRMMGFPIYWRMWEGFDTTVRTGRPAAARVLPEGPWKYLADHPEESRIFDEAMVGKSHVQIPSILRSYDFTPHLTFADIGGGQGHLLRAVLDARPTATGVLFDLPNVVTTAERLPMPRLHVARGDFFHDPLPSADCYLVMHVLHDWNDADALRILRAIRQAAPQGATVLVLESIIPDVPGPTWERILDMHMLALHGGRERSLQEYRDLLRAAGFNLLRTIDTLTGVWILESRVAIE